MAPAAEDELKRVRGTAKAQVSKILNKLEEIFKLEGAEATERQKEAEDTWGRLERARDDLKKAHSEYSKAVLNETDDEDLENAISELFDYIDAVDQRVYSILHLSKAFKARLGLEDAKESLKSALAEYNNFQIGSTLDKAEKAKGAEILVFPIESEMETNTKYYQAFRAAYDSLKTKCREANESWDTVLKSATPDLNMDLITQNYNTLNAGAKQLLMAQARAREKDSEPKVAPIVNTNTTQKAASVSPAAIKLEKAETISFSGLSRDYARFRREFVMIVVPDRSETEVGLRLRQAVPKEHRHLLDNINLENYKQMLEVLDEEFGTADRVVNSVMGEVNKLKTPGDDKAFVTFVEKLEAAARDLEAVDLLAEIVNQPTIASITEKFTGMIKYGWHEVL